MEADRTDPTPSSRMCRRAWLQGSLVTACILVGLGLAPLAACLTQPGGHAAAPAASCSGSCATCDSQDCASAPATVASGPTPKVVPSKCVGCGKCPAIAPKTFAMNATTHKAYVKNPTGDKPATIAKAAKACPTAAIVIN